MPVRVEIRGSESLMRKLDALSEVAKGRMIERAMVSGALLIQNAAKVNAPWKTGNLRRSIHIGGHEDLNPDGGGATQTTGAVHKPEVSTTKVSVYVGTNVDYARRIEFGFEGADSLGREYHQAAQPYLRPAVDENRREVVREVGEALRDLIKAAVR